jgi:hypothetical protein
MNAILKLAERQTRIPGAGGLQERLYWSGTPHWAACAVRIWRAPIAAFYFLVLLADGLRHLADPGKAGEGARQGELALLIIGAGAVGVLLLLAWLTAHKTQYEVTETHLVMRFGVGLRATLVIPFGAVEGVAVSLNRDGTGDVAIRLRPGAKLNYLKLWPHARPLRVLRPEPMLRCLADAGVVGALLARRAAECEQIRARLLARDPSEAPGQVLAFARQV